MCGGASSSRRWRTWLALTKTLGVSPMIPCGVLQKIWDLVYKNSIPHTIDIGGPVYYILSQFMFDWHCLTQQNIVKTITQ